MVNNFTTANFEDEVLKSDIPVLVDFYADWCVPCKMMAPVLERLAEEFAGKVKIGKCNTDENMPLAQQYRIMNIPNMKLIKNGEVVAHFVGMTDADEIRAKFEEFGA